MTFNIVLNGWDIALAETCAADYLFRRLTLRRPCQTG